MVSSGHERQGAPMSAGLVAMAVDGDRVDSQRMRDALGCFATGIAVITALDRGEPVGFTCQSFASLSLEPPYVSFAAGRDSTSWPRIRRNGQLCANVLAADQTDVCSAFAVSGGAKFACLGLSPAANGAPRLDGVLASVEADVVHEFPGGDHTVVIGHVTGVSSRDDVEPLLYFRSRMARLTPWLSDRRHSDERPTSGRVARSLR
jgi:flavin reductase (DIM6/NTAB) family NADH-FMN oxidoreductase RutF